MLSFYAPGDMISISLMCLVLWKKCFHYEICKEVLKLTSRFILSVVPEYNPNMEMIPLFTY